MLRLLRLLPKRPQPIVIRYGVTAVIIFISCLIQYSLYQVSGFTGYFTLLPGIFLSGFLFDRGSAFIATFFAVLLSLYLLFPLDLTAHQLVPLTLFVIVGILCAFVSESMRKTLERLDREKKEKELLLSELGHRTKNNLMNVSSLLLMQASDAEEPKIRDALTAAAGRVTVLANVHDFLAAVPSGTEVYMDRYLDELCQKIGDAMRGPRPVAIRVQAEKIQLPEPKAVPIAIITNELLTNCFKYAFPKERGGLIQVNLRRDDAEVVLQVLDDGVGCAQSAPQGLGSRLIQLMTTQLGGTLKREGGPDKGCQVTLRIPK